MRCTTKKKDDNPLVCFMDLFQKPKRKEHIVYHCTETLREEDRWTKCLIKNQPPRFASCVPPYCQSIDLTYYLKQVI